VTKEQQLVSARNSSNTAGKYVINVKQIAKGGRTRVKRSHQRYEEGMRAVLIGPLIQHSSPPKIDPTVSLMTVEDKSDVTMMTLGAKDATETQSRFWIPLCIPNDSSRFGIDPPKGVLPWSSLAWKILSAARSPIVLMLLLSSVIGSELSKSMSVKVLGPGTFYS
jgi:ATP-dependent 26S proteasome regulatory subunit